MLRALALPRFFQQLGVAGAAIALLSAGGACCPDGNVDAIYLIREPDPDTQALIDACSDPVQPSCLPLCRKLSGPDVVVIQHCEMHVDRDGYRQVHVGYDRRVYCE